MPRKKFTIFVDYYAVLYADSFFANNINTINYETYNFKFRAAQRSNGCS